MSTVRAKLDDRACGPYPHPVNPRDQRFIYAFWHESILISTRFHTKIHVLISQHADGEFIAQVCRHLRFNTIRGSTTRGGSAALLETVKAARNSHIGFTPDGPRGPRRKVQPGVIYLASKTGLPILSFGVGYVNAWRAKSWDRFAIPKPFSTMMAVGAPPMYVPAGLDRQGIELYRLRLESQMLTATQAAEDWAAGKPLGVSPFADNHAQAA
jgi:lysophospholipid acyltransferase (LPLAT)-like uncharacterized protein